MLSEGRRRDEGKATASKRTSEILRLVQRGIQMLNSVLAYGTRSAGNVHSPHEGYSPIGNDDHKSDNNNGIEIGGNAPLSRACP